MATDASGVTAQYLTFVLRDENFALEIENVREVLDVATLTKIPRLPDYISGVINLRGKVVPVMDLGQKLGHESINHTHNTCIIIVDLRVADQLVEMGILTDSVQMVMDMQTSEIEDVPKMGTSVNTDFIKGMGKQDEKFLIILDIAKIFATDEQEALLAMQDNPMIQAEVNTAGAMEEPLAETA